MRIGAQIGNVLTLSTGGLMCSSSVAGGWPLIFYTTGVLGLVWGIFWIIFYADSPNDQRCISDEEKDYILSSTHEQLSNHNANEFQAPWKAILTSPACWGLFAIHTCNNWGTYTFMTSIPKYMAEVLKFDIKSVIIHDFFPKIFNIDVVSEWNSFIITIHCLLAKYQYFWCYCRYVDQEEISDKNKY